MAPWDRRSGAEQRARQDAALARQVADRLLPGSPFAGRVLREAGLAASDVASVADLDRVPALGEHDLCPDGNPSGASALVVALSESDYAVQAPGSALRRALRRRVADRAGYARQVQDATRPVAYHLGGLDFPLPIASTREDLDVVARAGARAWRVLGLAAEDLLVSALDPSAVAGMALPYAALGGGAPAVHAPPEAAAAALTVLPATVVAVPDADTLDALGVLPPTVRTVLVTEEDPDVAALAGKAAVRRIWAPPDGRWLYPECPEGGAAAGLHTFPDLEVLQTVHPGTGRPAETGELVLTQLGVQGSALLRWRTGTLHAGLLHGPCPGCGRTVPRIPPGLRVADRAG